ncbi:Zinc finger, CCHC-type [Corchorus olitorius]|uniref:Zinc finger, CCHC-type n=1 Tax=Corchorus olitorius TaxID=93759 RepID=A0A1R3K5T1_9ROSI|nr:Zinc finger, CCHC-type [Corchorus olitorius]
MNNDLTLSKLIYPELKTTYRLSHSGTNFHIWRSKLDFVLVDNQVNYVLTEPKPSKDNLDDVVRHDKWAVNDFKARHIILGTLDDNLYMTYQKQDTAKSLMEALTMVFARTPIAKFTLFKRYVGYKMKEGTNINLHIVEMEAMAKELELEGLKMPEEIHSTLLLQSLPESWGDDVAAIEMNLNSDEDGLGFDNICCKLRNAGCWKEFCKARNDEEESSSSRDGSRGGFKGNCYNCGEFGHRKSFCPN